MTPDQNRRLNPDQLRQVYLNFFADRDHQILPSASLVPENDPTTLFTGSGMQPLLPYFLGEPHPLGTRVTNSQKCFRSQDIDEVGDNRHTTFFEMLGNWSFGDYFKPEQLRWVFTFFTEECGLEPTRLYVSIYRGHEQLQIPLDTESVEIWQQLFAEKNIEAKLVTDGAVNGLQGGRIFAYGDENWWSRVGAPDQMPVGEPGGPDSEVFYDFGSELKFHENSSFAAQPCHPNCDCGRFMEIGNSVFMTYLKTETGFTELTHKNIDFGGGFERILAAMNQDPDVFTTELFQPMLKYLTDLSGKEYQQSPQVTHAFRVIADHMKAAVHLAADGVFPANKEQGYFSRRLIRRAIRYADLVGIEGEFVTGLVAVVADLYQSAYPEIKEQLTQIQEKFAQEEQKFRQSLRKGLREFDKLIEQSLTAEQAFKLYETYGFPLEMSIEEATQRDIKLETSLAAKFEQLKHQHAAQSRQATQGKFRGGLADNSEAVVQYHTATHLIHAALRAVLGEHVAQKGSNITADRLRFDFSHPEEVSAEQLARVEKQVNEWIEADLPVTRETMSKTAALEAGAVAFFLDRYPEEVSIYTIGQDSTADWISKEFCGGPHVTRTSKIEPIEIYQEQSSGAGVRRIYARMAK